MSDPRPDHAPAATPFAARLLSVALLVLVALLTWRLSSLLMLLFAGIVLAVGLRALSEGVRHVLPVSERWAGVITVLLLALVLGLLGRLLGGLLLQQFTELESRLPAAWEAVLAWLQQHPAGRRLLELTQQAFADGLPWGRMVGFARGAVFALGNLLLILVLAVYLALAPGLYVRGTLRLLPVPYREDCGAALDAAGRGLRQWLLGQLISMVFVGLATTVVLWSLGVPLATVAGLISGLLAFVPFFGAFAGGLLAVLLGFMEGPQVALWVALLCILIQQVEGNLLMPLVQRWAVSLPPVLGILASVLFGLLFGIIGVLFATPLMVVTMILVRELYVRRFLEQESPSGHA